MIKATRSRRRTSAHSRQDLTTVGDALDAINEHTFEFAMHDFNLGDETSIAVADELITRKIPFAFATGYYEALQEGGHANAPVIEKPYGNT